MWSQRQVKPEQEITTRTQGETKAILNTRAQSIRRIHLGKRRKQPALVHPKMTTIKYARDYQ